MRDEYEEVRVLVHQWDTPRIRRQRQRDRTPDRIRFNARLRVMLPRLLATLLASCTLLSSVHLSLTRRRLGATLGEPDDDYHAVASLCQLPSLRLVRLDGFVVNMAAYTVIALLNSLSFSLSVRWFLWLTSRVH